MAMKLFCQICNRVTLELSEEYMAKVLTELTHSAQSKIVECPMCHRFQFALGAKEVAK
jgi:uncharacterized protein with PIN domain